MPRTFPGECALVVDDEPDTLSSLRELLLLAGVPVVKTARSLSEAAARLTEEPRPAAVVLDLMLDGDNGEHLLSRMRADSSHAATPVLLMSGDHAALDRLRSTVAATFLKPADPDALVAALVEAASAARGAG